MERNRLILFGIIGAIVIIPTLIYFRILPGRQALAPASADLTFWGTQEDIETWRPVLQKFSETYTNLKVAYAQFNENTYEETLINRLAEGRGPDIFMLKSSWATKHRDKLFPLPQQAFNFLVRDFMTTFVDGTANDLITSDGQIIGLPLYIDSLALFYNKDKLNAAGIAQPPRNWDELIAMSRQFTRISPVNEVLKSGLAIGTYSNVDHAFEIMSSIMLQNGDAIVNATSRFRAVITDKSTHALELYASFADPANQNFSWSARMPSSLQAFAQEDAMFVFGESRDIWRIRAMNPHLSFGVVSFPQPVNVHTPAVYGSYYFPAVSKASKNPTAAWQFVMFLTREAGTDMFRIKTQRPPARRDLLNRKADFPELDPFYGQSLIAKGWLVPDEKPAQRLFEQAVEDIVSRSQTSNQAVQTLRERLDLLLPK